MACYISAEWCEVGRNGVSLGGRESDVFPADEGMQTARALHDGRLFTAKGGPCFELRSADQMRRRDSARLQTTGCGGVVRVAVERNSKAVLLFPRAPISSTGQRI